MQDEDIDSKAATIVSDTQSQATRVQSKGEAAAGDSTAATQGQKTQVKVRGRSVSLRSGTIIDNRFVLEDLLGQGGMSYVYRAIDKVKQNENDPNPYVAIKILRTDLARSPEYVTALQRETKKMQMLSHPRIVTVHDFQIDKDSGIPFIQMEYLQGESLHQIIRNFPDGFDDKARAISVIMSIADGLEYAHRHKIVHSDLKPSNVFVTEEGEVKILDFGIARAIPGSDSDDFDPACMGGLTPAYATREMFSHGAPDYADDIYALGIIAQQVLSGHHPYESALIEKAPAIAAEVQGLKPTRPKGLSRRQWRTIAASLSFDRKARPADARAFLKQFRKPSHLPKVLGGIILMVSVALIWQTVRDRQLEPDAPFESLPIETQAKFNTAIKEGWQAVEFRDYDGALHYFVQAFELHPHNAEAVQGLDEIVTTVVNEEVLLAGVDERARARTQVETLLKKAPLEDRKELIAFKAQLDESLNNRR